MKKVASIILSLSFVAGLFFPFHQAQALVPPMLPFGGWPVFILPCTCSFTIWAWFAPLYLGGPVTATGPLVYVPYSTIPFANFLPSIPAVPHDGAYIPGVQACWMYVGIACVPLPSIGVMGFVGTGLPGGK